MRLPWFTKKNKIEEGRNADFVRTCSEWFGDIFYGSKTRGGSSFPGYVEYLLLPWEFMNVEDFVRFMRKRDDFKTWTSRDTFHGGLFHADHE